MARYAWFAAMVAGAASLALSAAPEAGPKVEVVGLEIMKPDPANEFGQALVWDRQGGTTVMLKIEAPDKQFIALDEDATKVAAWTDDKGTNLAEKIGNCWLGEPLDMKADRRTALFRIHSEAVPAPGAREMSLDAVVGIKCGSEEKTVEQKDFALKAGSELTVGPAPMRVKLVEKGQGLRGMQVEMEGTMNPKAIKELVFLGADGKAIEAHLAWWSSSKSPGHMEYTRTYELAAKVDTVTVRITYFANVETLTVPVHVKVGVGF